DDGDDPGVAQERRVLGGRGGVELPTVVEQGRDRDTHTTERGHDGDHGSNGTVHVVTRFDDRLSDQDAPIWNIEKDPILRSTIVAVALLDRSPDMRRLRRRLDAASIAIPRLRQTAVSPPLRVTTPSWVVEPDFDLDFHLRHV